LKKDQVIVLGAGGGAKHFLQAYCCVVEVLAFVDETHLRLSFYGVPVYDSIRRAFALVGVRKIVITIAEPSVRKRLFLEAQDLGGSLWRDVLVFGGLAVSPDCSIGENVLVHQQAAIAHDVSIGKHCFIGIGAVLCGYSVIEDEVFLGANCTILPHVRVGKGSLVGAGAVVTKDVRSGVRVWGVPAREEGGKE